MNVTGGDTNVTSYFQMRLTAGGDGTGLTIADFDMSYTRSGALTAAKVDCVALAAADTAHTDNRGIEVDATDCPGLYRFDWPDAAFAAGVRDVILTIKHASTFTESLRCQIDTEVSVTEWNGVKLGTTNPLPNAAADAAGGLPISDAGGLDMDTTDSNVAAILVDTGTTLPATLATIDGIVDDILVDTAEIGPQGLGLTAIPYNIAWSASIEQQCNDALVALHLDHLLAVDYNPGSPPGTATALLNELVESDGGVARFTSNALDEVWSDNTPPAGASIAAILADVTGINGDPMRGTDSAALASVCTEGRLAELDAANLPADIDAILVDTAVIGPGGIGLDSIPYNIAWNSGIEARCDAALVSIHLDHLLAVDYDPASQPGTATALLNELIESDGGVSRFTANALEQGPGGGGGGGLNALASGTAQGGTASTIQLASAETFANDELNGNVVNITGGTGAGQSRYIHDYTGATDTADVTPNWTTNPSSDSTYEVVQGSTNVVRIENIDATDQIRDSIVDDATQFSGADIAAILTDTAEIGAAGAGLNAIPYNLAWSASIEQQCTDALVAIHLDHLLAVDYDPASKPGTATALLNELVESDGGVSRFTANAMEEVWGDNVQGNGTDIAFILADTGNMQPKLGTITDLGSGATIADNLADMAGATFATGTDSLEAIRNRGDAAWITGSGTGLTALASGTAKAGTASTIQLASGETFANDELNGNVVKITSGTGAGQARYIYDYTGATDTADVTPNWTTNPSSDSVYEVVQGSVNVVRIENIDATDQIRDAVLDDATRFSGADIAAILVDTGTTLDAALAVVDSNVDAILVDTGTTLPATLATIDGIVDDILVDVTGLNGDPMRGTDSAALASVCTEGRLAELDAANLPADIDAILVDTGTTIPGTITTIDTNVDAILVDTGTTLPASIATVDSNVDAILVDTGTTIPASIATIDGNVDAILVDTADMQPKLGTITDLGAGATVGDNLSDMAGATFATGTDSLEAIRNRGDSAWITGAGGGSGLTALASGTAQAGTASTIQLASAETFANDELNGNVVKITAGTGAGQSRYIYDYTGATDTADVTPNWTTNPSSDSVYEVVQGSVNVVRIENIDATDQIRDSIVDDATRFTGASIAAILADVTGLNGDAMRGTDNAALASVCTEARLAELDAANLPTDIDAILVDTGTTLDAALAVVDSNVDAILVDTGTTIPATIATVDSNVDAILVDTGTTLPATLATIDGIVDDILVDTGTTLDAALAVVDANVDAILVDTGTTLDAAIAVIDANVDAILVDTAVIGAGGAGLTSIPWNASWDAEVQSECNDALVAIHLDHLLSVDYDPASKPGTSTALLNELVESDGGVSRFTTNALEALMSYALTLPGQEAPPNAPTVEEALGWKHKLQRNKKDFDGSTYQLYDDAGSTVDAKAAISEAAGTVTIAEMATGP